MRILITGGAGFIGSAVIRHIIHHTEHHVINVDKLTYASNLRNLHKVEHHHRYTFIQADIADFAAMQAIFQTHQPDAIMNLAAESHVDRSIAHAHDFIQTNIVGTFTLLEVARQYWQNLPATRQKTFRFHQVSTDEVYGDLADGKSSANEHTPYAPSSPYSASKASSDHLVRAWHRTYGLPTLITHSSNNYGCYQFPEKLIPVTILNALSGKPLPIYGDGHQIRDWLYVEDHANALYLVLTQGKVGETYHIGGGNEWSNIELVRCICHILDNKMPKKPKQIQHYQDLITHVSDRLGHDKRYALDSSKIQQELGWQAKESLESGLNKTIDWYIQHADWWQT